MSKLLNRWLFEHPQSVDETYFEHLLFAGKFAASLLLAGLAAMVHAVIPGMFEKTASKLIAQMYERTKDRG